jgi:hypothetical protein
MSKFTAALNVIGTDYHVTLAFCDAKRGGKVHTSAAIADGLITDVVYWQGSNVTVALIDSELVRRRHQYYTDNGYPYEGYHHVPHATLSRGNTVADHLDLVGSIVTLGEEYIRIWEPKS